MSGEACRPSRWVPEATHNSGGGADGRMPVQGERPVAVMGPHDGCRGQTVVELAQSGVEEETQSAGRGAGGGAQTGLGAGADVVGSVCLWNGVQPAGEGAVGRAEHSPKRLLPADGDGGACRGQNRYDGKVRVEGLDERGRPGAGRHDCPQGPEEAGGGVQEITARGQGGESAGRCANQVRQGVQRGVQGGQPGPGVDETLFRQEPRTQRTVVVQRVVARDVRGVRFVAAQSVLGRSLGDLVERGLVQARGDRVQQDERTNAVPVRRRGTCARSCPYSLSPGRPP
ncbi:hypothetical protein SALBM135S_01628 [Streptomyces alboniger]